MLRAIRRHKRRSARVFGSVARKEATARSDLDLLVDFDEGSLAYDRAGLAIDLEELLDRKVDVVAKAGLHWVVRPQVLFEAIPL